MECETGIWAPSREEFGLFVGEEVFDYAVKKNPIIDSLLYENDILFIHAESGIGKSLVAMQLACCLTSGAPFLDCLKIYKRCNVLYVQTEGDRAETVERFSLMRKGLPLDVAKLGHYNVPKLDLDTEAGMSAFIEDLIESPMKFDVIIFDPLYTTVAGSLNDDTTARGWFTQIKRIRGFQSTSFIVLHHDGKAFMTNKGERISKGNKELFGSSFWSASANGIYRLINAGDSMVTMLNGKERSGPHKYIDKLEMKLVHPNPLLFVSAVESTFNETALAVESVLKSAPDTWFKRADIGQTIGKSKVTVCRALNVLKDAGVVETKEEFGLYFYKFKMPEYAKGVCDGQES